MIDPRLSSVINYRGIYFIPNMNNLCLWYFILRWREIFQPGLQNDVFQAPCWVCICPLRSLSTCLYHIHSLFYETLISNLLNVVGAFSAVLNTVVSFNPSDVIFLSITKFHQPLVIIQYCLLFPRVDNGKGTLKLGQMGASVKYNLVLSLLRLWARPFYLPKDGHVRMLFYTKITSFSTQRLSGSDATFAHRFPIHSFQQLKVLWHSFDRKTLCNVLGW